LLTDLRNIRVVVVIDVVTGYQLEAWGGSSVVFDR